MKLNFLLETLPRGKAYDIYDRIVTGTKKPFNKRKETKVLEIKILVLAEKISKDEEVSFDVAIKDLMKELNRRISER